MTVQPPMEHGSQGPIAMPPSAQARHEGPSHIPGIVCLVLGVLGVLLAFFVLIAPILMFVLAGGGEPPEWFDEFSASTPPAALGIFIVSVAVLAIGITLAVRASRRRRGHRQAA